MAGNHVDISDEWFARLDFRDAHVVVVGRNATEARRRFVLCGARDATPLTPADLQGLPQSRPDPWAIFFLDGPPDSEAAFRLVARVFHSVYVRVPVTGPGWWEAWLERVRGVLPHCLIFDRRPTVSGIEVTVGFGREDKPNLNGWRFSEQNAAGQLGELDLSVADRGFQTRIQPWLAAQDYPAVGALEARVQAESGRLAAPEADPEFKKGISGALYWIAFLKGYFEWRQSGEIRSANAYLAYFRQALVRLNIDPGLAPIADDMAAIRETVERRFVDFRRLEAGEAVLPVIVYNALPNDGTLSRQVLLRGSGMSLMVTHIDGYHRYFGAVIARRQSIPCRFAWEVNTGSKARAVTDTDALKRRMLGWIGEPWR